MPRRWIIARNSFEANYLARQTSSGPFNFNFIQLVSAQLNDLYELRGFSKDCRRCGCKRLGHSINGGCFIICLTMGASESISLKVRLMMLLNQFRFSVLAKQRPETDRRYANIESSIDAAAAAAAAQRRRWLAVRTLTLRVNIWLRRGYITHTRPSIAIYIAPAAHCTRGFDFFYC